MGTSPNETIFLENASFGSGYANFSHGTDFLLLSVGRKDDVIVHTSGEKTVPAPMEDILMSSP